jgi:hypothetical protein
MVVSQGRGLPSPLPSCSSSAFSQSVLALRGKQVERSLESKGCGLRSGRVPTQTPVPSWRTVPWTAWARFPRGTCHVLCVYEMFRQHVSRLSTCVCKPASFAIFTPHVSLDCRRIRSVG